MKYYIADLKDKENDTDGTWEVFIFTRDDDYSEDGETHGPITIHYIDECEGYWVAFEKYVKNLTNLVEWREWRESIKHLSKDDYKKFDIREATYDEVVLEML